MTNYDDFDACAEALLTGHLRLVAIRAMLRSFPPAEARKAASAAIEGLTGVLSAGSTALTESSVTEGQVRDAVLKVVDEIRSAPRAPGRQPKE
jgi:hypothetical protein